MQLSESCGYFEGLKTLTDYIYLPEEAVDYFSYFTSQGYRRAGIILYKNLCPHCLKCKSIRIPTSTFTLKQEPKKNLENQSGY